MRAQHSRWAWGRAKSVAVVVFAPLATSLPPPALSGREERREKKRHRGRGQERETHKLESRGIEPRQAPDQKRPTGDNSARQSVRASMREGGAHGVLWARATLCRNQRAPNPTIILESLWSCTTTGTATRGDSGGVFWCADYTCELQPPGRAGALFTSARHGCGGQAGCPWGRW